MNKENSDIINKFLLIADKFMSEMHLWDPKVKKYCACGPFTRHQKRSTKGSGINLQTNSLNNEILAEELHKPIKRRKVYSSFKDNIWGVDLADMQLISKYNKGIGYFLCAIDLFSKYAWVISLKNKKGDSIAEGFKQILDDSNRNPNKIWIDHGNEFYNNKFKSFFKENDIEMNSTFNEGKSVIAERFIKTLKNKIYKYMTTIGKNVYFNDLDDILKKYNNTVHSSIQMKPKDVTDDSFVEYSEETNQKDLKFKVGDNVRISKCENIFAKGYTSNWSEEVFVINKVHNNVPWTYLINDLSGEEIKGSFYEKEFQKTDQKEYRI